MLWYWIIGVVRALKLNCELLYKRLKACLIVNLISLIFYGTIDSGELKTAKMRRIQLNYAE